MFWNTIHLTDLELCFDFLNRNCALFEKDKYNRNILFDSLCSRYCAVCHPYTYRDLTQTRSVSRRVAIYVIPVIIFSIILNLPKFFETKIVYNSEKKQIDFSLFKNGSIENMEALMKLLKKGENSISYEMTSLRNNPDYIRYG